MPDWVKFLILAILILLIVGIVIYAMFYKDRPARPRPPPPRPAALPPPKQEFVVKQFTPTNKAEMTAKFIVTGDVTLLDDRKIVVSDTDYTWIVVEVDPKTGAVYVLPPPSALDKTDNSYTGKKITVTS